MTDHRRTNPGWITGPVTRSLVAGLTLTALAAATAAAMFAVELSRVSELRAGLQQLSERVTAQQRALAALVDLPQDLAVRTEALARAHRAAVDRALQPIVARVEALDAEVRVLGETVQQVTTAAAIVTLATGRPVHPVPDLPDGEGA